MPSPHDVLGVDRGADEEAIRSAYRDRVLESHPDHGGTPAEFRRVRSAYEELLGEGRSPAPKPASEAGSGATGPRSPWDPSIDWTTDESQSSPEPKRDPHTVEYVDYEVLSDHGWQITDDDLFEKASEAGLDPGDYGRFQIDPGDSLLEGAEDVGFTWPFSCRGGACANCAVAVIDGSLSQPVSHILPEELTEEGIRLSCVGEPVTDDLQVVYNVKHLPGVEDLLLPPGPYKRASSDD
ncbi:ferredoxin Fer [Salinarchaeum chitinilyticum]